MNHEEARSLLAVHALDAIDDVEEVRRLEAHVAQCADCREELDRHRTAAAALAEGTLGAPPSLWSRIEAGIAADETDRAEVVAIPRAAPTRWVPVAAAVALVAMTALAGFLTSARSDLAETRAELAALQQTVGEQEELIVELTRDPIERAIQLARTSEGSLEALLAGEVGEGAIVIREDGHGWITDIDFAALDPAKTYQLWAIHDGAVISAGVLGSDPSTVAFHVDVERLDGLVITVEEAGGVVSSKQGAAAAWLAEA